MRKNKIILLVIVFMASMTSGYLVTRAILEHKKTVVTDPVIIDDGPNSDMDTVQTPVEDIDTTVDSPVVLPDTTPVLPVKKRKPSEAALTRIINDLNNRNYPRGVNLKSATYVAISGVVYGRVLL